MTIRKTTLLLAMSLPLQAGQFRHGVVQKEQLKATVPSAPQVLIGHRLLLIDVKDASGVNAPVTALQARLDQSFAGWFQLVQSSGETSLRVAVTHWVPAEAGPVILKQQVRVPINNPDGTPGIDPQTGGHASQVQEVAVESWVIRGEIALRVELVGGSGSLLDAHTARASIKSSVVISVNGQDRVDRTQLPTPDQALEKLVTDLAIQIQTRYCPPPRIIEIPLAVGEELRKGNKLAREGRFADAVRSWEAAAEAKRNAQADRLHNLGALEEAQAYSLLMGQEDYSKVDASLQGAAERYAAARDLDPREKYFERAALRIRDARTLVDRLKVLAASRDRALRTKTQPSGWPPGTAAAVALIAPAEVLAVAQPSSADDSLAQDAVKQALNDPRPDSEAEVLFRNFIRLRLRAVPTPASDEASRALSAMGPSAYSLSPLQARRIVHQETTTWSAIQPNVAAYRNTFAAFAQDTRISPEERSALRTLGANLGLSVAEIALLESAFKFSE